MPAAAAAARSAGYAPKPLPEKLGYEAGMAAAFIALPEHLFSLASSAAFSSVARVARWNELPAYLSGYDVIHAFAKSKAELEDGLVGLRKAIHPNGMIWLSWPKKASSIATDLSDVIVRDAALKFDLVDIKVAAIDETWSGLKFVIRKNLR